MGLLVLVLPSRQLYVPRYSGSEDNERRHDLLTHKLPKALIHLVKDHYNVKAHETSVCACLRRLASASASRTMKYL